MSLAALGLLLLAAKLSVRSVATGQSVLPGIAGAPVLGPGPTPTGTAGPARARLRVQVMDTAGLPVPQAIVEVRDRFNTLAGVQETGPTGEVLLAVPPTTGYVVTARKPGLAQARVEAVAVTRPQPGQAAPVVQVRLETAGPAATGRPARLYVGHTTPRLSVIDASSNLLLKHSEPLGQGRLTFVAPALDQGRLFTAWSGSSEVLVVDAADLSVAKRVALEGGGITSLAVNPQNGRLWVATFAPEAPDSSVLHELDGASQQVLRRLSFAGQSSAGLRFRPDAALLYVRHRSASALSFVDPAAGAVRTTARLPQWPTDLALSADGRSLYVVNVGSERLMELDAFTGEPVRTLEVGTGAVGVLAHPDGQRLLVLNQMLGSVQVVDLASGRVLDLIPVGRAPQALALAADGQGLYVANAGSGTVSLVDLEQRAVKETLDTGGTPAALLLLGPPRG